MRVMNLQLLGGNEHGGQQGGQGMGQQGMSQPAQGVSSTQATRMSDVAEPVDDLPF
jgi:hypothetical protein